MMDDALLVQIASIPEVYRQNLVVRGPEGPAIFKAIEKPFQRPILADMDESFSAIRLDEMPPKRRIWFEATKGCGKDTITAMQLMWLIAFTARPLVIEAGAADKVQADQLRGAAKSILHHNEWLRDFVEIQNFAVLNLKSGSKCDIIPADEMGAHGSRPDVSIINEVTHHADEGFYQTMMDNAAKVNTNVTIVLTNHGVLDSWQWKIREFARTSKTWAFHSYTKAAPWIEKATLEDRRRTSGDLRYRRLWEGQWVNESESALPAATIEAAVKLKRAQQEIDGRDRVFAGLDIGVVKDRSALVATSRRPGEKLKLRMCQSWKPKRGRLPGVQVDLSEVENAVLTAHQKFTFFVVYYDPSQCEQQAQNLIKKGVPMERIPFTSKSLQEMATALLELFNSEDIELYRDKELIDDLKKLRFIEKGNSFRIDAERDKDGHADTAAAFMLSVLAATHNPWAWVNPFIDRPIALHLDEIVQKQHNLDKSEQEAMLAKIEEALSQDAPVGPLSRRRTEDQRSVMARVFEENGLSLSQGDDAA